MESRSVKQLLPEGKGKEQVKEADDVKLNVAEDTGERRILENKFLEQDRVYEYGNEKEELPEANLEVKLDVAEDSAETLDALPHAEPSTAQRHINKERSPVEKAKDKCLIHKVHSGLRDGSAKHYEPVIVSIGPYHHGKTPLKEMEKLKVHYSQLFLERRKVKCSESSVEALKKEIRVSEALQCYWDTPEMEPESFEACLVCDGFFMIELFRKNTNLREYAQVKRNDIVFNIRLMKPRLERDMLLFENQIPLSALRMLFEVTEPKDEGDNFVPLVLSYFEFSGKHIHYDVDLKTPLDDIPHLLGLVYEALVLGKKRKPLVPETPVQPSRERKLLFESITIWSIFLRLVEEKVLVWQTAQQPNNQGKSFEFIRTAVALEQVGVKFVKADDNAVFHGINFSGKEFSIPRLVIDDNTESFFRNLVAYEQYSKNYRLHRVTDYLRVMVCLINTSTDVELLRHCGIIVNRIGDDEKVSTMFNHLCFGVYFDQNNFFYNQMFDEVNKFCKKRRNAWMAKLKNEYFSTPWTLISFLGALTLLLLTVAQTVFSVLSYINQPKS